MSVETQSPSKTVKGEVINVIRFDSGYAIVTLQTKKGTVKVVGELSNLTNGAQITFQVEEVQHPKYGKQYKSLSYQENGFSTLEGITNYLVHLFADVGIVTANAIVAHFGDKTLEVLDHDPKRVYEVPDIQKHRADSVAENWEDKRNENQILGKIMALGWSATIAKRIIERFPDPISTIENFPYDLIKVRMLGFDRVDKFALSRGVKYNSLERIVAATEHTLEAHSKQGHCYMMQDALADSVIKLLDYDITVSEFSSALTKGIDKGDFVFDKYKIFLAELYYAEKTIAERIFENDHYPNVPLVNSVEEFKAAVEKYQLVTEGITLDDEQLQALFEAMVERVKILRGGPGTGKALENSTQIPTSYGFVEIGSLKIGDFVIGSNGLPTKVTGVYPQGEQEAYQINFNDKTSLLCTKDHLWGVKNKSDRRKGLYDKILSTEQIAINLTKGDRLKRMSIPLVFPVNFNGEEPKIDPYLLGVLLGDGGLTQITPKLSNLNSDLINNISKVLPELVRVIPADKCDYRLSCEFGRWQGNSLTEMLKELNCMGCNSYNKFIPESALWSTSNYRWLVLQGLMDTDGTWDRTTCTYSSVSPDLIKGFLFILRSFGLKATLNIKNGTYNGKKHTSWRVCFNTPSSLPPFRISEKLSKWKPLTKYQPSKIIKSVQNLSVKKHFTCISVEAEDGLFCANDFIVTHNTTVTKTLCRAFEHYGVSFSLCSPTGKAAKKLRSASGYPASTIHRLLKYDKSGKAEFNKFNPLPTQCLIIDESSMIDVVLAAKLFEALQTNTRIIFIGDSDQLPPVGPGNVFKDLIDGGFISKTKLERIYRQEAGSSIISVAHDIIHGRVPTLPSPKESKGQSCMFVSVSDMELLKKYLITMITEQIPKLGIPTSEIQILSPMNKRGLGVEDLNPVLQQALNPPSISKNEYKNDFRVLRVGDRVMQIRNDYNKEIFNGDTGVIADIVKVGNDNVDIKVQYPDIPHPISYDKGDVIDIVHSFCCTVHKVQGSEYNAVIMILHPSHANMLQRNLFYTGVTRAKKLCIVMGTQSAIDAAVTNDRQQQRSTNLNALMYEMYNEVPVFKNLPFKT